MDKYRRGELIWLKSFWKMLCSEKMKQKFHFLYRTCVENWFLCSPATHTVPDHKIHWTTNSSGKYLTCLFMSSERELLDLGLINVGKGEVAGLRIILSVYCPSHGPMPCPGSDKHSCVCGSWQTSPGCFSAQQRESQRQCRGFRMFHSATSWYAQNCLEGEKRP